MRIRALSSFENIRKVLSKIFPKPSAVVEGQFFPRRDHDIIVKTSEEGSMRSKRFPNLSLRSVAFNGGSARLERDAKSEMSKVVLDLKNSAFRKSKHAALPKKKPVLPRIMEPTRVTEGLRAIDFLANKEQLLGRNLRV